MAMKKLLVHLGLGVVVAGLVAGVYVYGLPFLEMIELKAQDALFLARGPIPMASGQVAVVAIGERSLDEEGRWPWPRGKMAALIQAISDQGARTIGLDIGFFEPDNRFEPEAIAHILQAYQEGQPLSQEEIIANYHPDSVLAQVIASVKADVVLGFFFHMSKAQVAHVSQDEVKARRKQINKFASPAVRFRSEKAMDRPLLRAYAPENNQPILIEAARAGGFFNFLPDRDGVLRTVPHIIECDSRHFLSLSLATLTRFLGQPNPVIEVEDFGLEKIRLGEVSIPVDEVGRMWINFRGGQGLVETLEASDVLQGRIAPGQLKDKAVVVGVSAIGVQDVRTTPFAVAQPGVEVHAQIIDNVLTGDFLVRPGWAGLFDLAAILGLALLAAAFLGLTKPVVGGGLAALVAVAYLAVVFYFFQHGFLLRPVHPLLALAGSSIAGILYRYLTEEREKKWIRHAFQHYLNPSVIAEVLKDPARLHLGGEKRVMTVLFSDIRGFTSISEKLAPELLSHVLNVYLDRMTAIVFKHDGVLDKYIGDAVMAVWGAPVEQPDHAKRACRTALEMLAALKELDQTWEEMGVPRLKIGIGINTGPMVVGNMGSKMRFDYTVIGDNVNLGSRLEGQTKAYGVEIIASESVKQAAQDEFSFRILDMIRVKGKSEPSAIYQLVGERDGQAVDFCRLAEEAFQAYLARDFDRASQICQTILELKPDDQPALILQARCREYIENPPPEGWDGVETKKEK